jgi:hypothetical protein
LLAAGVTLLISLQAAINIGVVTSALPNKGLPLPFISYGGSNLLAMLTCVGILFSVARHAPVREKIPRKSHRSRRNPFAAKAHDPVWKQKRPSSPSPAAERAGISFRDWPSPGQLKKRGCAVALLISPKDVDQQAVKSARGMEIFTLPAVALQNRNYFSFAAVFGNRFCRAKIFRRAARRRAGHGRIHQRAADSGRKGFRRENLSARIQHHSRTRQPFLARLWTRRLSDFPKPGAIKDAQSHDTGTPVRPQFQPRDPAIAAPRSDLTRNRPTFW